MKKLSFILILLSGLFLSCSLETEPATTLGREHLMYIQLASTNETRLYYCYETIADAKRCNGWIQNIQNIDSWLQYAVENSALDSNVKNTMMWWPFEVTATDFPNERRYVVNIYQNGKFYTLVVKY